MPASSPEMTCTPAARTPAKSSWRLSRVMPKRASISRIRGDSTASGALPSVGQTTISRSRSRRIRSSESSTPRAVRQVQCSMPSTPASTACSTAARAWACAVTGRPRPCDSSTTQRSSSRVNWQAAMSVPGVMFPPLAITFTTSTRRSARSRTAARSASSPATSPPIIQQCPPTEVMGGPEATMCGPWFVPGAVATVHDRPPVVAQVPDRRHARGQLLGQRRLDHRVQVVGRELRQTLQGAVLRVAAQVDVRVDEAGQQRAVGEVDELDAVRHRRAGGLDAGDPPVVDEDHRAVRPQLLAVEGPCRPDRQHGDGVPHRGGGPRQS